MLLETKNGIVKIYAKTLENEALEQITQLANSVLGENANVRVMPDAHAGAGCVIGTTMIITDKVCPNLVGVDIGCGVDLVQTNIDFLERLEELDEVIRKYVPCGKNVHDKIQTYRDFNKLKCWNKSDKETKEKALYSLGTLGGGNHFIEAYNNGYLSVHSGSRNIGYKVAHYYQKQAEKQQQERQSAIINQAMKDIAPQERETWIKEQRAKINIDLSLAYLTGELMQDYLHDMEVMQQFAVDNRTAILNNVVYRMGGTIEKQITSTHNFIARAFFISDEMGSRLIPAILRKGAISAHEGEEIVIPLNMRDGLLLCVGKGNPDWNYSAPHGAGRLYSRRKAKEIFKVEDYKESMKGIFSTCVNADTIDEAPFVYKDYKEIIECIEPTVEVIERLIPIYNFKASE